jgi:hypothetical protein
MSAASSSRTDERGAALLIVLVFITALSLIIGALLTGGATAEKATVVTASLEEAIGATDAGVEYGLGQIRQNGGLCPAMSGPLTFTGTTTNGSPTITSATPQFVAADVGLPISGNGVQIGSTIFSLTSTSVTMSKAATATGTSIVTVSRPARMQLPSGFLPDQPLSVTCSGANAGQSPQSISAYAIVTVNPGAKSLTSQSAASGVKQIYGPTYVSGEFDLGVDVQANEGGFPTGDQAGRVFQSTGALGGCTPTPNPDHLLTSRFSCTTMTPPVPVVALPPLPALAPAPINPSSSCRVFRPGRYTSPLSFESKNYLASGTYYFDNIGEIDFGTNEVVGGAVDTAAGDSAVLGLTPCSTDAAAGVTSGDKGVQLILGGNSRIKLVNQAKVELLAFHPSNPSIMGGVSIRTVPPGGAPYTPTSYGGDKTELSLDGTGGNQTEFAAHGLILSPDASVALFATNTSAAQVLGGVVAWNLSLQASASATGLLVQVTGSQAQSRSAVVVEATVPVSATKTVKSRAVVDVRVSRTVTDGKTTNTSNVVMSNTALFSKADEGAPIEGPGIPLGATIKTFKTAIEVEISANATATSPPAGVTLRIDPPFKRTVADGVTTAGSKIVGSSTANFTAADVGGTIVGGTIPADSIIDRVLGPSSVELSKAATGPGTGVSLTIEQRKIVRVVVSSWRVENL